MQGRLGSKFLFMCATMLSTALASPALAASPVGFFVVINPYDTKSQALLAAAATSGSPYLSVFGPFSGCAFESPGNDSCKGGVVGVFLSVPWNAYQLPVTIPSSAYTTLVEDSSSSQTTTSYVGPVETALYEIQEIESALGHPLQITIGVQSGDNASYQALDVYQASNGQSYVASGTTLGPDLACAFQTSAGTITGSGGTFTAASASIFPTQCVLSQATQDKTAMCKSQPKIWASDSVTATENSWYVEAYTNVVKDLAHQVTSSGTTSAGQAYSGHNINVVKMSGIARQDLEIGIAGNPGLLMPSSNGTTYTCGHMGSLNAEAIWTDQSSSGTNYYDTGMVESTFAAIYSNLSTLVATTTGGTITNFELDTYATNSFPPVGPRHCHFPTQCTFTAAGDATIGTLTTGEEEYLAETLLSNGGGEGTLNRGNLMVQSQDLKTGKPSQMEPGYSTNEVPCAMQAGYGTALGYQTTTSFTFHSYPQDNNAYIAALSNGGTYGAQYIELQAADITNFGTNVAPGSSIGSDLYQLSTGLYQTTALMETNATNSINGSQTCPGSFSTY